MLCYLLLSTYKFFFINTRNLTYFPRDSRGFRATRNFTHFYLMLDQCILLYLIASNFVVVFVLQPRDKLGPRPRVNNFEWHISVGLWKLILCSSSQITQWKELFSSILDVFCSKKVGWILRESGVDGVRRITKTLAPCLSDSWVLHFVFHWRPKWCAAQSL